MFCPKRAAKRHISSKAKLYISSKIHRRETNQFIRSPGVGVQARCRRHRSLAYRVGASPHIERGLASHIDINFSQEQRISFPSPYEWAYCPAALPPRNKQSVFPLSQSVRSRPVPPAPGRAFRAAMPPAAGTRRTVFILLYPIKRLTPTVFRSIIENNFIAIPLGVPSPAEIIPFEPAQGNACLGSKDTRCLAPARRPASGGFAMAPKR